MTLPAAMEDPKLFADWFKPSESWATWRVLLRAIFGLPMSAADLEVFKRLTGRSAAPSQAAREAWLVVGRRGGKSRIASLIAVFLALLSRLFEAAGPRRACGRARARLRPPSGPHRLRLCPRLPPRRPDARAHDRERDEERDPPHEPGIA